VAQWWALTPKPSVEQLFVIFNLQELWNGIVSSSRADDLATIINGVVSRPSAYQWYNLSTNTLLNRAKPTISELYVHYGVWDLYSAAGANSDAVSIIRIGLSTETTVLPTVADWYANEYFYSDVAKLYAGGYPLQTLWNYYASLFDADTAFSRIYNPLPIKPSVASWWNLSSDVLLHQLKPSILLLSSPYTLQELWNGIGSVTAIRTELNTTIQQFRALSPRPTIPQLYDSGFTIEDLLSNNSGLTIADVLASVSQNGDSSSANIIADLKEIGFKIRISAPRITEVSYNWGLTIRITQGATDVPIEKYLYSYTNNGGQTWSDYTVIIDGVTGQPALPNNSGYFFINSFTENRKLYSFRIKAEGSGVESNVSNTFKNVFF
jgi:hypothetical protein